jgi:hypothetical protein
MARTSETWVSDELQAVLSSLSAQQVAGVLRIVQAEIEGKTLSSLLDCPGQICTSTTYYGSGKNKGWRGKPDFTHALALARRDIRKWMLENGVGEALTILAGTAPQAARALRQQVVGDEEALGVLIGLLASEDGELRSLAAVELGDSGLPAAVPALKAALAVEADKGIRVALLAALGRIAGLRDGDRRLAAAGVLDRADVKTAAKQAFAVNDNDVDSAIERELARLAAGGQDADAGQTADDAGTGDNC